jgi:hypothetical protein
LVGNRASITLVGETNIEGYRTVNGPEIFALAIPFGVMLAGYIAFRLVRRDQKRWHAAHGAPHEPAE